MMGRKALVREADGLLLGHGFVTYTPAPGETVRDVPDDFNETPRLRRWTGTAWADYTPPPKTDTEKNQEVAGRVDGDKALKALVLWCAGKFNLTPQAARQELAAIYRALPD
jgi:hypothetical protein